MAKDQLYISTFSWYYICRRFSSLWHSSTRCRFLHEKHCKVVQSKSMMHRWRVTSLRAGADFHFSCRVVVLEKQPFRNTFGLLADGRGQVDRERERERECMLGINHLISVAVRRKRAASQITTVHFFIEWANWHISLFLTGRICYTFTIMASSVYRYTRQSEFSRLDATCPKSFFFPILTRLGGRRTSAGGGFVASEEETEVLLCGWNDVGSSKFRQNAAKSSRGPP